MAGLSCHVILHLRGAITPGVWLDFLSSKAARLFFSLETIAQFDHPIGIEDSGRGNLPNTL